MISWLNQTLHPEPVTDNCGRVYVAPFHLVCCRVARGEFVFDDTNEAIEFVDVFREVRDLDGLTILAWCLMGNHYHLVVKTGNVDLRSSAARWLNRGLCDERDEPSFSEQINRLDAAISSTWTMTMVQWGTWHPSWWHPLCLS